MKEVYSTYPQFMKMVDLISSQNPLQKKRVHNFINHQDVVYWEYAEKICCKINQSFLKSEQEQIDAARSYNRMSMDFLREQICFSKTGTYRVNDASLVEQNVYSQPDVMRYYMVGLLLSYFLWPNHYEILKFLKEHIGKISIDNYFEIAPGHGLFASEVLGRFTGIKATLLDISETSLQVTGEILNVFGVDQSRLTLINDDFLSAEIKNNKFDFISMGEVLEHVNDASGFLVRARGFLKDKGTIFMSTCANCPAIDHVYHFRNADEIRSLISDAGLKIIRERVLPVETMRGQGCFKDLEASNYCAILMKEK